MKYCLLALGLITALFATAQDLFTMPAGQQSRVSSFEDKNGVKGAGGTTNRGAKGNAAESLKAGQSKTLLDISSPGIIQRIWMTIDDRSFTMLRSLRLRMYWDGSAEPAVDVPFGDFFNAALGRPVAFQSALFTNPEGRSFICYIPMPFKSAARIVLTNESGADLKALFYDVDFTTLKKPSPDGLYFHAHWRREKTSAPEKDFELLPKIMGKGRFIGVSVGVNVDSSYANTWWGEGEVKMYIDGDGDNPTINGTGAEDYIGTGWGEGVFAHQYQGCLLADGAKGQYAFYRFHIPDPVYFYQDLKVTIQKIGGGMDKDVRTLQAKGVRLQPVSVASDSGFTRLLEIPMDLRDAKFPKGWVNFYRVDDYSATAYFYLDRPTSGLPELAPVAQRTLQ